MRKCRLGLVGTAVVVAMAFALPATASAAGGSLELYEANVSGDQVGTLYSSGYDIASVEPAGGGAVVDLVLSDSEVEALARDGIEASVVTDAKGRTSSERYTAQARGGFKVFNDYDGKDGIAKELKALVKKHKDVAKLKVIGQTRQGRDILAVRVTKKPRKSKRGKAKDKPAVLYQATTHAREWISTEVAMRGLKYFLKKSDKPKTRKILRHRELWFLPVVNPDGYQYTFDNERLWRKNLRDNDGDGEIEPGEGVDINRNYPERWRYDDEGSETITSDDTYRGPSPASEPETKADIGLVKKIDPVFSVSYHSFGPLLLYPQGWQVQTLTADDPVYQALSGNDQEPAIKGFDPDVGAELYTTNGEFTDWAHAANESLAWTPELEEGCDGCGFVFPDNRKKVKREFRINRPFMLDLARSAGHPERPTSHLGNKTKPLYIQTVSGDNTRANNPTSDFRFKYSYGGPQEVQVLARKGLNVKASYSVNGGPAQTVGTSRAPKTGTRYGLNDYGVYYRELRATIPAASEGDKVEVQFKAGKAKSGKFTYKVVNEDPAEVLIVAAEDYSGVSNSPEYPSTDGPFLLSYYEDALDAAGREYDVYDVDARHRRAPDDLGVLSHYDAVVYYTGNDVITRETDQVGGEASRLANDEMLELRSYLNEGGKLLYTGQYAGYQYAFAYPFDPVANESCTEGGDDVAARCQFLSDDFLQYYLGAGIYNDDGGTAGGEPLEVEGISDPFNGSDWDLNGGTSADNHEHTASFLTQSSLLNEEDYPQFASEAPANYVRSGAAPFEPFDGSKYMYSNRASNSYKRLSHEFDLTGVAPGDANMTFQTSFDTEPAYDEVIVEVHHVGQNDWTLLPDENGNTTDTPGDSCEIGWTEDLHPFLKHYQTFNGGGSTPCGRTGTTGEWNSANGRSNGWQQWEIDLSDYAGENIEVAISYVSDYSVQGVGMFVDDIQTGFGEGTTSFEDDADPLDGWEVPGAPSSSPANPNDWERTASVDYKEGSVISTDQTLYFGFGFEGIRTAADRNDVMQRSMDYLLGG